VVPKEMLEQLSAPLTLAQKAQAGDDD